METTAASPLDWYHQHVLPALAEHLDTAFPEFAFKRSQRGWTATNHETTRAAFGVRADRVVCHGDAPPGFLIHGQDPVMFTAYLNNGTRPRGADFIRTARELATRAQLDTTPIDQPPRTDRRAQLLETFHQHCATQLASERGAAARDYLTQRGIAFDGPGGDGLGVAPSVEETRRFLLARAYTNKEIVDAGVVRDSRWAGRLTGTWRDTRKAIRTIWARTLDPDGNDRYLYLAGARRTGLPPYGLDHAQNDAKLEELTLVEGVLDVHHFRTHGITNIAALGSTSIRPDTFEHLDRLGIKHVVLALDNDQPGRHATARVIDNAARASRAPDIRVLAPEDLAPYKDPDAYLHASGPEATVALITQAEDAIAWRTRTLLGPENERHSETARRAALNRVGRWLSTLPPRLALEQEDALTLAAHATRYNPATVTRAFQARYWKPQEPARTAAAQEVGR